MIQAMGEKEDFGTLTITLPYYSRIQYCMNLLILKGIINHYSLVITFDKRF